MRLLTTLLGLLLTTSTVWAANAPAIFSSPTIVLTQIAVVTDRYSFSFCNAGQCQNLGSAEGYTATQIEGLSGRWEQVGAVSLASAETFVIWTGGVVGASFGAAYEVTGAVVGTGVGTLLPITALRYLRTFNPYDVWQEGQVSARMENSVRKMISRADTSMIIYQSDDLATTLEVAARIDRILQTL